MKKRNINMLGSDRFFFYLLFTLFSMNMYGCKMFMVQQKQPPLSNYLLQNHLAPPRHPNIPEDAFWDDEYKKWILFEFKNDILFEEGVLKEWTADGFLTDVIPKYNGKYHGEWIRYKLLDNGSVEKTVETYSHGIRNGEYKIYLNDVLHIKITMKNDVENGPASYYDEKTGMLFVSGLYENGKKVGTWKCYDDNGEIFLLEEYEDGKLIKETYVGKKKEKEISGE